MMFGRNIFRFVIFLTFLPVIALAEELPSITITEKTDPKIAELYQQIQNSEDKINQINSEHLDKLSENYEALKENEQSTANKTLTALTTAATGIGGMELAMGLSEKKADAAAEKDMDAYLQTFSCTYADGKRVKAGPEEVELPGGNDEKLMGLRAEYLALAADLKERKEALGMKPGIESEKIYDKAEMGLYDDESTGITGGAYESLYRAKASGSEEDQTKIDELHKEAKTRTIAGGVAAGAGVVGGMVGNAIINKDAPKNESDKINREYNKKVEEAKKEQKELKNKLNQAIAENATKVKNFNSQLDKHKEQIVLINQAPKNCQEAFADYVSTISNLSPIENETDAVPDANLPDVSTQNSLLTQCKQCDDQGAVYDIENNKCSCPPDKPIEKDGKCIAQQNTTKTNVEEDHTLEDKNKDVVEPSKIEDIKKIIDAFKDKAKALKETECTI